MPNPNPIYSRVFFPHPPSCPAPGVPGPQPQAPYPTGCGCSRSHTPPAQACLLPRAHGGGHWTHHCQQCYQVRRLLLKPSSICLYISIFHWYIHLSVFSLSLIPSPPLSLICHEIHCINCAPLCRYDGEEGTLTHMRGSAPSTPLLQQLSTPVAKKGVFSPIFLPTPLSSVHSDLSTITVDEKERSSLSTHGSPSWQTFSSQPLQGIRNQQTLSSFSEESSSVGDPLPPSFVATPTQHLCDAHTPHPHPPPSSSSHTFPSAAPVRDTSLFGSLSAPILPSPSPAEEDRRRIECQLQACRGPCLLDCIQLDLTAVDVFSARKVTLDGDSYRIDRQVGSKRD